MSAPSPGLLGSARKLLGEHDRIAIGLVFIAGVLTILHKSGVPIPYYAIAFGVALGIAALLYEMNATTYALRSFWKGRLVGTLGWAFVWVVAFGYSMNQWMGAASENEANKSNLHKAAFHQTANARQNLDDARKALHTEQANYAEVAKLTMTPLPMVQGKAVSSIEQAQALVAGFKADTRRWDATEGCKITNGKNTREFCVNYTDAVAALKDLEGRKDWPGKLAAAQKQKREAEQRFLDAQTKAETAGNETTEARNDLVILTSFVGLPEDKARVINALGSIVAVSLFLSLARALREIEHLRAQGPRVPLFPILGWFRRKLLGGETTTEASVTPEGAHPTPASGVTTYHVEMDEHGRRRAEEAHALAQRLSEEARAKAEADAKRKARIAATMQKFGLQPTAQAA